MRFRTGCLVGCCLAFAQTPDPPSVPPDAEFHFIRMQYVDREGTRWRWGRRSWWMQDWPEAEVHFAQGVRRLTRIHTGEGRQLPLLDDCVFDYPWLYATQVGYWDLSEAETDRLREYLLRGGFLVVDDFYGLEQWSVFQEAMQRVCLLDDALRVIPPDSHSSRNP